MTYKEFILDSLADGSEEEIQIKKFFEFLKVELSTREIRELISEMINEELICVDDTCFGEKSLMYKMTLKGKKVWEQIPDFDN